MFGSHSKFAVERDLCISQGLQPKFQKKILFLGMTEFGDFSACHGQVICESGYLPTQFLTMSVYRFYQRRDDIGVREL
jgi:hypothetical protein